MKGYLGRYLLRSVVGFLILAILYQTGILGDSEPQYQEEERSHESYSLSDTHSSSSKSSSSSSENGYVQIQGYWGEDTVSINNFDIYPFYFNETVYGCRKLYITYNLQMNYNTHCKNWDVNALVGNSWRSIGNFYVPEGDGQASDTIYLSSPEDIRGIVLAPKASGSFSWTYGMNVYEIR